MCLTGTKLDLFGSSKNGFGFKQSDLDICMTIDGLETAEVGWEDFGFMVK